MVNTSARSAMVYSPVAAHPRQLALLPAGQLGLLAAQFAFGAGDGHAFAGAHPQQAGLEFGEGGQDVEEHLAHRVGGVVDLPAERQLDAAGGEVVADRAGVGHGPGEPVELRHHERVAGADGGEGLVQAGALRVGAGEPVVEVYAFFRDAELAQPVTLRGEVLVVGGAAGVSSA
jgi:hypothetical protein